MNNFTIKDLENLSGIKAHTLRIWEQRYGFLKPERSFTNIRNYSNEELKQVLNISLLNKYGYKISKIDKMSSQEMGEKILSLTAVEAQQERIVNELIQKMIDLEMEEFDSILGTYILARGIERTVSNIIFPFLSRIGILWLTNHINPAQEHLVSNIIRQKLILGIEGTKAVNAKNKSALLFLPEGELHELGLLFMHYLLKSRGINVIYLGANIPLKDVIYVARLKKPDFLHTHLTTAVQNFNLDKFLGSVSRAFPHTPVIISGALTNNYKKKLKSPIHFKQSHQEILDFIS